MPCSPPPPAGHVFDSLVNPRGVHSRWNLGMCVFALGIVEAIVLTSGLRYGVAFMSLRMWVRL